jgi:hypothetical protein
MLDKMAALNFLNRKVRVETDSASFNHFVGFVREVTERALILEFLDRRIIAFDLQDIVLIKEAE